MTLPVVLDGRTARLVKVARALQVSGGLPVASARRLVGLATAVRLFAEAGEHGEMRATLDALVELGREGEGERPGLSGLLGRHARLVREACRS